MSGQAVEAGPSIEVVRWAAEQAVRMHEEGATGDRLTGRCKQCTPEGCTQYAGAKRALSHLGGSAATP